MLKFDLKLMRINLRFSIVSIITIILGSSFLISLGLWQLARAAEKDLIVAKIKLLQNQTFNLNQTNLSNLVEFSNVEASGEYDPKRQYIYDNNIYQGKAGFYVLTPFQFGDKTVLINRGWQLLTERDKLKKTNLSISSPKTKIKGRFIKPVNRFTLANNNVVQTFPMVIQAIDLDKIEVQLGVKVLPFIIELAPDSHNGFVRNWQPFYGSSDKHIAYAIQWFSFAVIFLVIMFIMRRVKD